MVEPFDNDRPGSGATQAAPRGAYAADRADADPVFVCQKRELAELPEPRYLCVAPSWFRMLMAGMLMIPAVAAGSALALLLPGSSGLERVAAFVLGLAVFALLLKFFKPFDWRAWIEFGATPDGLYLPGRGRLVVFVPWGAVRDVDVKTWATHKGKRSAARLTLALDPEAWSYFGNGSSIEGDGEIRRVLINPVDVSGEDLAAHIRTLRDHSIDVASA